MGRGGGTHCIAPAQEVQGGSEGEGQGAEQLKNQLCQENGRIISLSTYAGERG